MDYDLYPNENKKMYSGYKFSAVRRKKLFTITKEEFNNIIINNCYICGRETTNEHCNGIDRYDNAIGYIKDNCRACCGECNYMKRDMLFDDFMNKLKSIHEYQNKETKQQKYKNKLKNKLGDDEYKKKNREYKKQYSNNKNKK